MGGKGRSEMSWIRSVFPRVAGKVVPRAKG
jgi:hypothetical protein